MTLQAGARASAPTTDDPRVGTGRSTFSTRHADQRRIKPTARPADHPSIRAYTTSRPRAPPAPRRDCLCPLPPSPSPGCRRQMINSRCDTPESTTGRLRCLRSKQHMQTRQHRNHNYKPTMHRPAGPQGLIWLPLATRCRSCLCTTLLKLCNRFCATITYLRGREEHAPAAAGCPWHAPQRVLT